MYLILMSRFLFFFFNPSWCWLIVSLPPFLPHWAVTWFKVYCTGRYATGSGHKGRERERERENEREEGGGKNCRDRDSLLLSHPPLLFSHTVNTDDPGCRWWLHSATAVGWWWRRTAALCLQTCGPPRAELLSDGIWSEGLSDLWLNSPRVFISTSHNSRWFYFTLSLLPIIVWSVAFKLAAVVFGLKSIPACSTAKKRKMYCYRTFVMTDVWINMQSVSLI